MKRMVKNGNLIDVEPDGTITVAGKPVGGGGSDYTAGSNIEISEAKEIAVKSDLTGIDSIDFNNARGNVRILGYEEGDIKIKSLASYNHNPSIYLESKNPLNLRVLRLSFKTKGTGTTSQSIAFDVRETAEDAYAFLTIGSQVPFVPSNNGTYVLKATVTDGAVTYTWESQA